MDNPIFVEYADSGNQPLDIYPRQVENKYRTMGYRIYWYGTSSWNPSSVDMASVTSTTYYATYAPSSDEINQTIDAAQASTSTEVTNEDKTDPNETIQINPRAPLKIQIPMNEQMEEWSDTSPTDFTEPPASPPIYLWPWWARGSAVGSPKDSVSTRADLSSPMSSASPLLKLPEGAYPGYPPAQGWKAYYRYGQMTQLLNNLEMAINRRL